MTHLAMPGDHLRKLIGRLHVELAQQAARPVAANPVALALPAARPPHASRVVDPYVIAHSADTSRLEREAIHSRSHAARDLLALVASSGNADFQALAEYIELAGNDRGAASPGFELDHQGLLALARVLSAQALRPTDPALATRIYEFTHASFGPGVFSHVDWIDFIGLLTLLQRRGQAMRLLAESGLGAADPYEYACLHANLLVGRGADTASEWLAALNTLFELDDIEPVSIAAGDRPEIDRILCPPRSFVEDGPLVSVLMTNYSVGEPLRTAVEAVLGQSWRRLELIIVDDCSPDEEFARVKQLEGLDARISVSRTAQNGGTYTARNVALSRARGEFVTCHDADDWSHPRKIEAQVRHLLGTGAVANLSRMARTTEELAFERFSASGRYVYANTSSLMFRREQVCSRLGAWDEVRTGADTEFYKRIELVFGEKLEVLPGAPLSFARTRPGALTSGTLSRGWSAPARRHYRAAWAYWHRHGVKDSGADLPHLPTHPRVFPAPDGILPVFPVGGPADVFDVVVVADLRCRALAPLLVAELDVLAERLDVAVCHLPSLRKATAGRELLHDSVQALINRRRVTRIEPEDTSRCALVLVRDPTVLQFADGSTGIRAQQVLIATDKPPFAPGTKAESYAISTASAGAQQLFGVSPRWASSSPGLLAKLRSLLPDDAVLDDPWMPVINIPDPDGRTADMARTPSIGFCFTDASTPWSRWSLDDARLFPVPSDRVRILGGRPPSGGPGEARAGSWTIMEAGEQPVAAFLANVDFVPYFPRAEDHDAVTPVLAHALAAGCIVLAPPRMRPLLGDAAAYVDADEASALIDVMSRTPGLMAAQSRRAVDFARMQLGADAFANRIDSLLAPAQSVSAPSA